jgi:homoserine O-acetyltransferase
MHNSGMTNARRRRAAGVVLLLVSTLVASGQAAKTSHEAPQQFANLGELKLQSGAVIHDFRLGYRTAGSLNSTKSNAILWPTFLGGKSQDLLQYVGPGNIVDTSTYFVILVDAIGDGVTTSPSNSTTQPRMQFPEFTIRDMVEAEHRLATEILYLPHLRAVMGNSMGGMQTFEWVTAYPDFMDIGIPMNGSPQSTSYDNLFWTIQMDALKLDPNWKDGTGAGPMTRGFELYNEIASMNLTSPEYRAAETRPKDFDAFLAETRKSTTGDAAAVCDAIRQRQAINALDIPGEYSATLEQAARRTRAKLLVVVTPQDHVVNPAPALAFANAIGAPVLTLDSPCGHISLSCISIGPIVAQFLANPQSVHATTLRDSSRR